MADSQKIEPLLWESFYATAEELAKSPELSAGIDLEDTPLDTVSPGNLLPTWEVIIRYVGDEDTFRTNFPDLAFTALSGGYGILRASKEQIIALAGSPLVTYIEKPKNLYFEVAEGRRASCINSLQNAYPSSFTGRGVLVGIIDSGIDYMHPDFRNADGTTRIAALWDQSIAPDDNKGWLPPQGYSLGTLFTEEQINEAINAPSSALQKEICPSIDLSGHGTHVAGIAAGNGANSGGVLRGVAYEAALLVVKLAPSDPKGFPNTTQLMQAINFCVEESIRRFTPLALNISLGNTYGSHSGTSLIETFIDTISEQGRCSIVIGSGNEGSSGGHTGGILSGPQRIEFSVSDYTPGLSIQLWKHYSDDILIAISGPVSGMQVTADAVSGTQRYRMRNTNLLLYYGEPSPYSIYQEIYIDLLPVSSYLDAGVWSITLIPQNVQEGSWEMWLPSSSVRSESTRFLLPTPDTTLTIPSTSARSITVGAYDAATDALAAFSGRGYTWSTMQNKPDLVAPGVDITSCAPGGGYTERTGTSMAAPFVTGSAACLMQWGIVLGNDPFLYGEKLKAYLRKGARPLPAFTKYPNPEVGWGALCLNNSVPG